MFGMLARFHDWLLGVAAIAMAIWLAIVFALLGILAAYEYVAALVMGWFA